MAAKKAAKKARERRPPKPPPKKAARARNVAGAGAAQREIEKLTTRARKLEADLEVSEQEKLRLAAQLTTMEAECKRYFDSYVDVELQNTNVANLYVASLRLHSTLDRDDVITAIQEIVINLIGSEELAIFELDPERRTPSLVSSFGVDPRPLHGVKTGVGVIGRSLASGEIFVATADRASRGPERDGAASPEDAHVTACVPLVVGGRVTGAVAIFRLLEHKRSLEDVDHELFSLLGTQAATALYCTRLLSERASAR